MQTKNQELRIRNQDKSKTIDHQPLRLNIHSSDQGRHQTYCCFS